MTPKQSKDVDSSKITCATCHIKDVPDWDGKGHCIKCARDLILGSSQEGEDS